MNSEKKQALEAKHQAIKGLTDIEKNLLFGFMDAFQDAAQQTIAGGEELARMCNGCAFRKNTEANNHPITALVAIESVLNEEPFYCHQRFCPNGEEKLCNGWINIMNNK